MLRNPAVSGHFYKGSPEGLRKQVGEFIYPDTNPVKAIGVLVPHAGLVYSGAVAGAVYSRLILPETFILIGPNHTGIGAPVSVFTEGVWAMPNGSVSIDSELARTITEKSRYASEDYSAHEGEHSLEVQIPFLQYFRKEFNIVPLTMMSTALEVCREVGVAISQAIKETGKDVLIIASSDMTHYESGISAREKDQKAIEKILALDPSGLHHTVKEYQITMCGFAPAVTMLYAAIELGSTKASLLKYMNSGDVSGDYDQVVGYAGIIIS